MYPESEIGNKKSKKRTDIKIYFRLRETHE